MGRVWSAAAVVCTTREAIARFRANSSQAGGTLRLRQSWRTGGHERGKPGQRATETTTEPPDVTREVKKSMRLERAANSTPCIRLCVCVALPSRSRDTLVFATARQRVTRDETLVSETGWRRTGSVRLAPGPASALQPNLCLRLVACKARSAAPLQRVAFLLSGHYRHCRSAGGRRIRKHLLTHTHIHIGAHRYTPTHTSASRSLRCVAAAHLMGKEEAASPQT